MLRSFVSMSTAMMAQKRSVWTVSTVTFLDATTRNAPHCSTVAVSASAICAASVPRLMCSVAKACNTNAVVYSVAAAVT